MATKKDKIAIDSKAGEISLMFRDTCRKMKWWDWSLIKMASMLFGIMLAALCPEILGWFDWYWWIAIFALIIAVPTYKIYGPNPKPKKAIKDDKVAWIGGTPGGLSGLPKAVCRKIAWWDTGADLSGLGCR